MRPTHWGEVKLKLVPLQPDEDEYGDVVIVDPDANNKPVSDPLGIVTSDLRIIQTAYVNQSASQMIISQQRQISASDSPAPMAKRSSAPMQKSDFLGLISMIKGGGSSKALSKDSALLRPKKKTIDDKNKMVAETENESKLASNGSAQIDFENNNNVVSSILPKDKSFNPALFLSLVHNKTTITEFQSSMKTLNQLLAQQSDMRASLVRLHLGLFIDCVAGSEWLKHFEFTSSTEQASRDSLVLAARHPKKKQTNNSVSQPFSQSLRSSGRMDGEKMASSAVLNLTKVRHYFASQ